MNKIHLSGNDITRSLKFYCHQCGQKLDATGLDPFSKIICPACNTELIVPIWFDNYLLEEPVGQGGMASVYRALDLALDREVAIKLFNTDSVSERSADLFLHEARTAATINHYAIIPIYTCGTYNGQAYMVMQYMSGGSLDDLMMKQPDPIAVPVAAKWIHDVAEGLNCASKLGIVHHDVKPGNIMLDGEGHAKIGDFGISNSVKSRVNELVSEAFKTFVTPNYVSPEKIMHQSEDTRGDIYSLGATFFHILTRRAPFENPDVHALANMRLTVPPPIPTELRADIPKEISNLILEMMHLNPARRPDYPTIAARLNRYLSNAAKSSRTNPEGKKMVVKTRSQAVSPQKSRSSAIVMILISMAVVGGGVFAAIKVSQSAPADLPPAIAQAGKAMVMTPMKSAEVPPKPKITVIEREGYLPQPVTATYLADIHAYPESRPRFVPFYAIDPEEFHSKDYLSSLVPSERKREEACIAELNTLKPYLVKMMGRMLYGVSPLKLRQGKSVAFHGTLKVTSKYISVPISEDRSANYDWVRIDGAQFETFLRHYANIRKEAGDKTEAAAELMRLGIFLDWNRDYERAAQTIEEAIALDPTLRQKGTVWFAK